MDVQEEKRELRRRSRKTHDAKQRRQYDTVRLWLANWKVSKIAEAMDMTTQNVYKIIHRYQGNGIDGLVLRKAPGRERKLTTEQEQELYETITTKLPKDVGLEPFCNWTAPLACQYVKASFGVLFSERGMRDVFYRLKLSYTRPTYKLRKADPERQAAFKERLEGLKRGSCLGISNISSTKMRV